MWYGHENCRAWYARESLLKKVPRIGSHFINIVHYHEKCLDFHRFTSWRKFFMVLFYYLEQEVELNVCISASPLSAKPLITFNLCISSRVSMKVKSCSQKLESFNRNCKNILFNIKSFLLFFVRKWANSVCKKNIFNVSLPSEVINAIFLVAETILHTFFDMYCMEI